MREWQVYADLPLGYKLFGREQMPDWRMRWMGNKWQKQKWNSGAGTVVAGEWARWLSPLWPNRMPGLAPNSLSFHNTESNNLPPILPLSHAKIPGAANYQNQQSRPHPQKNNNRESQLVALYNW
jgi:hypothetical protein